MLSIYENIVLVLSVLLYIGSVIYYAVKTFRRERKLKKSEIVAELDIITNKSYDQQHTRGN
ncbi:DUF3966 domain-containing protein [Microbacteriaceae bacterium 4G12]